MSTARIETAIARIEAAMARIDAAQSRAASAGDANVTLEAHAKLRDEVAQTIGQIDALIAELEG